MDNEDLLQLTEDLEEVSWKLNDWELHFVQSITEKLENEEELSVAQVDKLIELHSKKVEG